jgi:hypothetical protein
MKLLSDDLWSDIARQASDHERLRAAIAYVTADYLKFRSGDVLVCDASDVAIAGGLTSAFQLQKFLDAGAEVYSYSGLHSKIAVFDSFAIVGSANLSANAGVHTCEASLLTDDPQVVALALAFVEKVRLEALPITPEFIQRIQAITVVPRRVLSRTSKKRITVGKSRVWFVATRQLSERIVVSEAAFEAAGIEEAKKRARPAGHEIEAIRWSGRSAFRAEAKDGDVVIQAFTYLRGKRKVTKVYPPAPIVHRQDEGSWTRFYVEYPSNSVAYRWSEVEDDFKSLGVRSVSRGTTRELDGKALGIIHFLK